MKKKKKKMAKTSIKRKDKREGFKPGAGSMNPDRKTSDQKKGIAKPRSAGTIKRLQMYKNFKAKRDKNGKVLKAAPFQSWVDSGTRARVQPARGWFSNTKVISQNALQKFQEEMGNVQKDPYKVVMNPTKLPVTLLQERAKYARVHMLDTEPFSKVFGKKAVRKRPNIKVADMETMVSAAEQRGDSYDDSKDRDRVTDAPALWDAPREWIFGAGQSKRIWNELYKVIDSSDVIIQVLDARDPMGTRSETIEKYMKKEKAHKHLMFVLNKVDLVPTWITQKWVALLSQEYPTIAFHASINHPFGKGALINLLRQIGKLHQASKQISVGFIGYPNVGKSSVINALRNKKVCNVAPIAGETKVWQYITLMRKIYLIDCPGVVPPGQESDEEKVLRGVVRVELVESPDDYIPAVLERTKPKYIERTYNIKSWTCPNDFLEKLCKRTGKLLKGGEPDLKAVSKMVLNDWQRGKLPYFIPPPGCSLQPKPDSQSDDEEEEDVEVEEDNQEDEGDDVEDVAEDETLEDDSDNETTCTNDTSVTADSLFESVKFDKEDEEEEEDALMRPPPSLPENLQELVKQDLGKIVQSVEYFDEEKYEGGRKRKKKVTEKEAQLKKVTEKVAQSKKVTEKEVQSKKATEKEAQSASAVSTATAEEADDVSAEASDAEEAPEEEAAPKKQEEKTTKLSDARQKFVKKSKRKSDVTPKVAGTHLKKRKSADDAPKFVVRSQLDPPIKKKKKRAGNKNKS